MEILLVFWLLAAVYLVLHYLFFHLRLLGFKESKGKFEGKVSVIICARNEAENLKTKLPFILNQDYPDFEVVIVNDRSEDDTAIILENLSKEHAHLKVISLTDDSRYVGKKKALSAGINNATNEYLLLTDADCEPSSSDWISRMSSSFLNKEIVLGFGGYEKEKGITNKLVRWETLQTAIQYFSFALTRMPYMGVGRNLAYKKELFKNSSGFESHIGLPSGDDDLFVSENGEYNNIGLVWDTDSFTYSKGPENFKKWWRQKRRHMSTSSYYRFWPKTFLTNYGTAQLAFYVLLPLVAILFGSHPWFLAALIVKFALQLIILIPMAIKFKSTDVLWLYPLWEMWTTLSITFILLQNKFFGKPKAWK